MTVKPHNSQFNCSDEKVKWPILSPGSDHFRMLLSREAILSLSVEQECKKGIEEEEIFIPTLAEWKWY